jgi:hypothetical protein
MGIVERSRSLVNLRAASLLALAGACLALSIGGAPPASARLAESLARGEAHFTLDRSLASTLAADGVRVVGLGKARVKGRSVTMPLRSGFLEYGGGSGYVFLRGGLAFRGPGGSATLGSFVLNTAKGRVNAKIDGRNTNIAAPQGVDGRPTRYGLEVAIRSLALTGAGARSLDRALGLSRVFVAGKPLARARIEGETFTVPVNRANLEFSFDEGFRRKLADLGVAIAPTGSAIQLLTAPLAFSFPDATGSGNNRLSYGTVSSPSALHLIQGSFPDQHEASIGMSVSFESALVGSARETWPASHSGAPLGETSTVSVALVDADDGSFEVPTRTVKLSAYGAPELNGAFGTDAIQFSPGEVLGTVTVAGRLGR